MKLIRRHFTDILWFKINEVCKPYVYSLKIFKFNTENNIQSF